MSGRSVGVWMVFVGACAGGEDTDAVDDVLPACPVFAAPVSAGTLASDELDEVSGIAASRAWPGTWWMHNDSGDAARVFAVDDAGADLGAFTLPDVLALDWEDMTVAPDGDGWSLVLGDIGDNAVLRPEVWVWRIPEPDPTTPGATGTPEKIRLKYPDGAHNAETLMADPRTGDLYIVSKINDVATQQTQVFRAPAPWVDGSTMELVATLAFGGAALPGDPLTTGGDISPDGDLIAIRTYTSAFVWRRTARATVGDALGWAPCPVPQATEPQGEAIAWDPLTGGYRTVSEFAHPTIWAYDPE